MVPPESGPSGLTATLSDHFPKPHPQSSLLQLGLIVGWIQIPNYRRRWLQDVNLRETESVTKTTKTATDRNGIAAGFRDTWMTSDIIVVSKEPALGSVCVRVMSCSNCIRSTES